MKRAVVLLLALAACTKPARSTDWFVEHPHVAATVADRCVLERLTSEECANATAAIRKAQDERLKLYRKGF